MALSRRTGARFQASIWPGFVDAMTGLLLVLMFVLTIFMIVQFVLTERITGQEQELDVLGGEVAALAEALGLEERTSETLRNKIGQLDASLTGAQAEIANLIALRDRQAIALDDAQSQITSFEAQVATLLSERDTALADISALQTQRAELFDAQSALNLALAAARSDIDEQQEAARLAAAKREALDALITDLRAKNAQADAQSTALSSALLDAQEKLTSQEAARLVEAEAAAALRKRLKDADTELTAMTLALEAQRKDAEDTLTLLAAARATQADIDAELSAALLRVSAFEADAKALRAAQDALVQAKGDVETQSKELRQALADALAEKLAAQTLAQSQTTQAERRTALLAQANEALSEQSQMSAEAQRQTELLNQQVAALRAQLGDLQALIDDAKTRDQVARVQLQSLGSELNTALARVAAAERRKAELEAAERKRLEAEAQGLKDQAKDLEQYRSEFFGQLRDVLGAQDGVRIAGDRFVFSSEVLFGAGQADLSADGKSEIAKVARILRTIAGSIPPEIDWIIRVDGHTDDVPLSGRGAFVDNWELSQARALSVVRYMTVFLDIPPDRLSANGFGQYHPVAIGNSEDARAQNRRIELKLTEK